MFSLGSSNSLAGSEGLSFVCLVSCEVMLDFDVRVLGA